MMGCGDDPAPVDAGDLDAGSTDGGPGDSGVDAGPPPVDVCAELSLPVEAFDASATGSSFESVAGDFTVNTLDGPWTLSEEWSGCESYVFINYASNDYGMGLWASTPDDLFTLGPRNVHYFFASYDLEGDAARARVEAMRTKVEEGFDFQGLPEEERAFWRTHIHYVTDPVRTISGSVGTLVLDSPIVLHSFAVTREQRFDPVGSLFQVGRTGFEPRLAMARFAAPYFDYIHDLDAQIAADTGATVVSLMDAVTTGDRTVDRTVTLPDVAAMAAFDALEVDVELTCHLTPDACSEWDRIAYVFFCEDATCAVQHELVRWITPYSRPGRRRWLMDATAELAMLRAGGDATFRIVFGPDWEEHTEREVSVDLRFATRGATDKAMSSELAYRGGAFDASYNAGHAPVLFTPPAGTTRVELAVILSGHGMDAGNCAEWCNHVHTFTLNGAANHVIDYPAGIGEPFGCADKASEGVPPGQWGNWAPERAYWCPGLPVPTRRFDITSEIDLGAENELTYRGTFMGGEPAGGNIDLTAYLVYYQ